MEGNNNSIPAIANAPPTAAANDAQSKRALSKLLSPKFKETESGKAEAWNSIQLNRRAVLPHSDDGEGDLHLLPFGTRTGRYFPRSCARIDPLDEGIDSELGGYGAAVTSYFKSLKWFFWTFLLLSIITVPQVFITVFSNDDTDIEEISLFMTTIGSLRTPVTSVVGTVGLGNVSFVNSSTGETQWALGNVTTLRNVTSDSTIRLPGTSSPASSVAATYIALDILGVVVFMAAYLVLKVLEAKEARRVDKHVHTIEPYTLYVENVPGTTTEGELRDHFEALVRRNTLRHAGRMYHSYLLERAQLESTIAGHTINPLASKAHRLVEERIRRMLTQRNIVTLRLVPDDCELLKVTAAQVKIVRELSQLADHMDILRAKWGAIRAEAGLPPIDASASATTNPLAVASAAAASASGSSDSADGAAAATAAAAPIAPSGPAAIVPPPSDAAAVKASSQLSSAKKRDFVAIESRMKSIYSSIGSLQKRSAALTKQLGPDKLVVPPPVCAFITFNRPEIADSVIQEYGESEMAYCCQPPRLWFHGRRLRVMQAPPPSAVLFKNLNAGRWERCMRQLSTAAQAFLIIVVFCFFLFMLSAEQQVQKESNDVEGCDAYARDFRKNVWTAETIAANITADPDSPLLNDDLFPNFIDCFCSQQVDWESLSLHQIRGHPLFAQCADFACPAIFTINSIAGFKTTECRDYVAATIGKAGPSTAAAYASGAIMSLAIVGVNFLLEWLMDKQVESERHHSTDLMHRSLAQRLFVAEFITTAVLPLIVASPLVTKFGWLMGAVGRPGQIPQYHDDFEPLWYRDIGTSIMAWALLQIVTPHAKALVRGAFLFTGSRVLLAKAPPQGLPPGTPAARGFERQVQWITKLPPYDFPGRWAQLVTTAVVCYMFSTGIPLLNIAAFAIFGVAYISEKLQFLRLYRSPDREGNSTAVRMTSFLPLAVLLKVGFGAWMISGNDAIAAAVYNAAASKSLEGSSTYQLLKSTVGAITAGAAGGQGDAAKVAFRLLQPFVLPYTIIFIILIVAVALSALLTLSAAIFNGALSLLTCGAAGRVTNEAKARLFRMPDFEYLVRKGRLVGIDSYNMLASPSVVAALGIRDPDVAYRHDSLTSYLAEQAEVAQQGGRGNPSPSKPSPARSRRTPTYFVTSRRGNPSSSPGRSRQRIEAEKGRSGGGDSVSGGGGDTRPVTAPVLVAVAVPDEEPAATSSSAAVVVTPPTSHFSESSKPAMTSPASNGASVESSASTGRPPLSPRSSARSIGGHATPPSVTPPASSPQLSLAAAAAAAPVIAPQESVSAAASSAPPATALSPQPPTRKSSSGTVGVASARAGSIVASMPPPAPISSRANSVYLPPPPPPPLVPATGAPPAAAVVAPAAAPLGLPPPPPPPSSSAIVQASDIYGHPLRA